MAAVAERVPARVIGDGLHTVRELIEIENRDPRRGFGHTKILTRLPLDEHTTAYLEERGLTLESRPASGDIITLRPTANSRRWNLHRPNG